MRNVITHVDRRTHKESDGRTEMQKVTDVLRKYVGKSSKYWHSIFTYYFQMKIYMHETFINISVQMRPT